VRYAVTLTLAALALTAPAAVQARSAWPVPPAWWLHGPGNCIRIYESTDGRGSTNLYGMLDGWTAAGGDTTPDAWHASRTEQNYRAYILWRRYGWQPWTGRTRDHCEP
jgi:hypothetical protein